MPNALLNPPFIDHAYTRTFNLYRRKLEQLYGRADMAGVMEATEDVPVNLRDIYVPLRVADEDIPKITSSEQVEAIVGNDIASALLQTPYLAISGLPGSGKTTLTHYLAGELSRVERNSANAALGRQVVIPIILRELDFSTINSFETLWQQWRERMATRLEMTLSDDFFNFYLNNQWAVVIFDGFDELSEQINQALMQWINAWIASVGVQTRTSKSRFFCLITARPSGFLSGGEYEQHFHKTYLQPFNQQQIDQYVHNWYGVRYPHDSLTQQAKAKDFIEKLKKYRGLAELKHRPIYLAMLAYVAETYGELPVSRTLAYSKMVDAYVHQMELIKNFNNKKGGIQLPDWHYDDKIRVLETLAFTLHTQADPDNAEQMHILVSRDQLLAMIQNILKTDRMIHIKPAQAEALLGYFVARTGLLIEPQQGYFQFSHLTFQEFLTAKRIYRKLSKRDPIQYLKTELFNKIGQAGWHEVILLYFGIDTLNSGEDHDYVLQRCLQLDNAQHERFLIDLLITTDHTLGTETVLAYLRTLVFLWSTSERSKEPLYWHLAQVVDGHVEHPEYAESVVDYLTACLDQTATLSSLIQSPEDTQGCEELLVDQ